jgi:hypothetical protein
LGDDRGSGFNRRKMVAERKAKADAEAAARRATDAQVVEDAARLIDAWNEPSPANALVVRLDNHRARCAPLFL